MHGTIGNQNGFGYQTGWIPAWSVQSRAMCLIAKVWACDYNAGRGRTLGNSSMLECCWIANWLFTFRNSSPDVDGLRETLISAWCTREVLPWSTVSINTVAIAQLSVRDKQPALSSRRCVCGFSQRTAALRMSRVFIVIFVRSSPGRVSIVTVRMKKPEKPICGSTDRKDCFQQLEKKIKEEVNNLRKNWKNKLVFVLFQEMRLTFPNLIKQLKNN